MLVCTTRTGKAVEPQHPGPGVGEGGGGRVEFLPRVQPIGGPAAVDQKPRGQAGPHYHHTPSFEALAEVCCVFRLHSEAVMQMIIKVFTSVRNAHKGILLSYNKPDKYSIKNMTQRQKPGMFEA